jgi:hypothetical protein
VSDLRDHLYKLAPENSPEAKLFLDYHQHSAWAVAKAQAGLRLPPESIPYMQRSVDERARATAAYAAELAKELENEKSASETAQADTAAERVPPADGVRGAAGS